MKCEYPKMMENVEIWEYVGTRRHSKANAFSLS